MGNDALKLDKQQEIVEEVGLPPTTGTFSSLLAHEPRLANGDESRRSAGVFDGKILSFPCCAFCSGPD